MDIYIAIDEKDKHKFIFKAEVIKNELLKENLTVNYTENIEKQELTKKALCLAFTDDIEYIKRINENKNIDIICITTRLESTYILELLNYVKDIYFVNVRVNETVKRIKGFVESYENRKKCIRGKNHAFKE